MLYFKNLVKQFLVIFINQFVPNAPFPYPLKFSENVKIFLRFDGVEGGAVETNKLKVISTLSAI